MIKTKRGGGPKTPAGKLAASSNAIKTGAYSRHVVLPGENEQDFLELVDQFNRDFMPNDIAEAAIVRELAVLTWKRLRIERLEHNTFLNAINAPIKDFELISHNIRLKEGCEWLLGDLSVMTPQFVQEQFALRKNISSFSGGKVTEQDFLSWPLKHPLLFRALEQMVHEFFDVPDGTLIKPQWLFELKYDQKSFVNWALNQLLTKAEQVMWVNRHLDKLKVIVTDIKEKRMLKAMQADQLMRVNDDLSRAFFRTLGELRRQQKWRKDISIIDVTETPNEKDAS